MAPVVRVQHARRRGVSRGVLLVLALVAMACVTTFVGMSRLSREKVVADLDADVVDDADEADGGEWAGPRTLARPTAFSSHTSAVRIAMPRDDGRGGAGAARSARRGGMPGSAADTIARRESADAASMAERMRDKVLAHLERSTQLSEHAASKATSANKQYTSVMGEIASGYDLEELPEATLAAATERCNEDPRCQGFSFAAAIPDTRRALRVVLKTSRIASPKPGHWSWIRPIQAEARTRVDPHAHVRGAAGGAAAGGGAAAAADGRRDVTLVTQTSVDRLWMLKKLCDVWPGPVSAAVFVVGNQMADASVELERSRCAKQGHVAYIQGRSSDHYPVNALRNKAREWVSTSHWLVTDVDLWPSDGTYDVLLRLLDEDWAKDARTAVVVPAFATRHKELKRMPSTLSGLARCIGKRECYAFKGYPGAIPAHHLTTNYPYWWHETTIKSRPVEAYKVPCFDTMVYEPYVMVPAAKSTPLFDERFTGYGKNKIQFVQHLRFLGFQFYVAPKAFLMHAYHPKSESRHEWRHHKQFMDHLFGLFINEMSALRDPRALPLCTERLPQFTSILKWTGDNRGGERAKQGGSKGSGADMGEDEDMEDEDEEDGSAGGAATASAPLAISPRQKTTPR